jgi:hypothetical protein
MDTPEENTPHENTLEQSAVPDTASNGTGGMSTNRKIMLALIAALVLVAAGMYAWKAAAVAGVEDKLAQTVAQDAQARTQLIEQARQLEARAAQQALGRFSIPFAWAVRREVMAANLDQVDQYFAELVQMKDFRSAVLADPAGKILVASDRKQLAAKFSDLYPAQYLQVSAVGIEPAGNGALRAVIPIMGLDKRLATVVLDYKPPAFTLQ